MQVTEPGMVIEVKPEQLLNALLPMLVTVFGITVFIQPKIRVFDDVSIMALQLSRLS